MLRSNIEFLRRQGLIGAGKGCVLLALRYEFLYGCRREISVFEYERKFLLSLVRCHLAHHGTELICKFVRFSGKVSEPRLVLLFKLPSHGYRPSFSVQPIP